jgi:hypothetical protein
MRLFTRHLDEMTEGGKAIDEVKNCMGEKILPGDDIKWTLCLKLEKSLRGGAVCPSALC